ncbi:MAG: HesA/MoeB/ThiF family protein [Treponema sp.]|nr:HesA/MoeB/ThiF family protein [Treponema sp.]
MKTETRNGRWYERYERNIGALTREEQKVLETKRAAIVGCGGLGCYAAEFLARMGLGHITVIDGDVYAVSNLNRQLYSLEATIGQSKAQEAKKRLLQVRADMSAEAVDVFIDEENAGEFLKNHDVIIDALDNVKTRLLLERTAKKLGIVLVHGAVREWSAQICTVYPGDSILSMLYPPDHEFNKPSVLPFTPAFCAAIEACEAVKVLLNKDNVLRRRLLTVDLRNYAFDIIELDN